MHVNVKDIESVNSFYDLVKKNGFSYFNQIENTFGEKLSLMLIGINNKLIWFDNLPKFEIPEVTGYSMGIDSLQIIVDYIMSNKPKYILELGSGLSSVVIGNIIENFSPETKLISIDGEKKYQDELQEYLKHLNAFQAKNIVFIEAPLVDIKIDDQNYKYYNPDVLKSIATGINMVIVDGPQYYLNNNARYPAYNLIKDLLGDEACIFLDDSKREFEQEIIKIWQKEINRVYSSVEIKQLDSLEGITKFLLKK